MSRAVRTARARSLRRRQTPAEALLWQHLRAGRLDGLKFRRQHPVDRFFADFACERLRLVVELDGRVHEHDDRQLEDHHRQTEIEALGWCVLRFRNETVTGALPTVLAAIREQARLAGAALAPETPFRDRSVPRARPPLFKP